jgi:hypothetical protein
MAEPVALQHMARLQEQEQYNLLVEQVGMDAAVAEAEPH